jgi:TM2 domain-containing membrane protein YozV
VAQSLAPKETGIAYALMLLSLMAVCGIQHFYLGKTGRGVLWLLTFGLLGVGLIIDLFTLPQQVKTVNARRAVGIR